MANPEQFEAQAKQLTSQAERHEPVSDELNAIPFEERLTLARRMDEINATHRNSNPSLPDLELTVEKDFGGREHLMDMQAVEKGAYLWLIDKDTDVYDMPKGVEGKTTRKTLDIRHSEALKGERHNEDVYE